ncbi:acetoacetate decarboxylase family protein [Paenibacillus mendelii]|uniref:Acetoacetate decarboxylase n=1 Tax=Paenibacillus mendelii TaxID=206163 RepID=A0ABV6JAI2_9BACL|nr:acetoacetate decarboxylase [Paenibacillus mendelii]MCQ6560695.1 acetoacetate decarboxylase [Paenibacillus mendelii]
MTISQQDVKSAYSTPIDNPLIPRFPVRFRNNEILTVIYRTDPACIERIVPDPLESASDLVVVHYYHMNDAEWFGNYYESAVQVQVRLKGTDICGAYSPYLYLGSDGAIAAGREVYGQPKKSGNPSISFVEDLIVGKVERNGIDVLTSTMAYKQRKSSLDEMQEIIPFTKNINLKIIPNIDGTPAIHQITARTFSEMVVHECWRGPATMEIRPNAQAPVYKLPVLEMMDGFFWVCDFSLPMGEVIHDYLK